MEEINRQLKKGMIDILLLKLLEQGPMYGYQLITTLDKKSGGVFASREGTLYPVLYRLEDGGFIKSFWEKSSDKRAVPRKYYEITDGGKQKLFNSTEDLKRLFKAIQLILGDDLL